MHDKCPVIDEPVKRKITLFQPPSCDHALVCLCCADGGATHRFWFRYIGALKHACPFGSDKRTGLVHRRVVTELAPQHDAPDNPWSRELVRLGDGVVDRPSNVYFHIGDPVLSPWGVTVKPLHRDPARLHVGDDGVVHLLAQRGTYANWQAFEDAVLSHSVRWSVRFGLVVDSEARVPSFTPQHVAVAFWSDFVDVYDPTRDGPAAVRRANVSGAPCDSDTISSDESDAKDDSDKDVDCIDCFALELGRLAQVEVESSSDDDPLWGEVLSHKYHK